MQPLPSRTPRTTVAHEFPVKRSQHILVVDDSREIAALMQELLASRGYDVRLAYSAADAEREVASNPPDLILLDVMMPRMSGHDLCQSVRENPAWSGIKILMLSAKGRDIDVTKGIAVGADAYLTKPFSTKELTAKVQQLLGE